MFALASAASEVSTAKPDAVATGMQITLAVAGVLIVAALAIAIRDAFPARHQLLGDAES